MYTRTHTHTHTLCRLCPDLPGQREEEEEARGGGHGREEGEAQGQEEDVSGVLRGTGSRVRDPGLQGEWR